MRIQYVGKKDVKTDNVAGTGLVWLGNGDVQDVPSAAAPLLLRHATVWLPAPESKPAAGLSDAPTKAAKPAKDVELTPEQLAEQLAKQPAADVDLAKLDDEQLRDYASQFGIKPHHKKTGDTLRAAIVTALAEKKG